MSSKPGLAWHALLTALAIMLLVTLWPRVVVTPSGHVDHCSATLLAWAMSAGFVRGVGFVPEHAAPRWALSGWACALALALAALRLAFAA